MVDMETSLAVFSGCGAEPNLACNDDSCSFQSELTIAMDADTTYLIRISGYNSGSGADTGEYVLFVSGCSGPIVGDLNSDCKVDFKDIALIGENWLECNLKPEELCLQ